jgi:hypothetical protein
MSFTYTVEDSIPILEIKFYSASKISDEVGHTSCQVSFQASAPLLEWEARAGGSGHGTGLLVGDGGNEDPNTDVLFDVDFDELTQGDGDYIIYVYGKDINGNWTA